MTGVRFLLTMRNHGKHELQLLSSQGVTLFYVALHPGCTIVEIMEGLGLTRRTVWSLVGQLRRAGMLHVTKLGRRHQYRVNMNALFLHPTERGIPVGVVVGGVVRAANGRVLVAAG